MDPATSSASPEQPNRISTFVSSTYRPWTLMQGSGYNPATASPPTATTTTTFMASLPQAGNCALGGCGDVYSEYAHECSGVKQCGVAQGAAVPAAPQININSQQVYSSTDCTIPGAECANWLSYHNCAPYTHLGDVCGGNK